MPRLPLMPFPLGLFSLAMVNPHGKADLWKSASKETHRLEHCLQFLIIQIQRLVENVVLRGFVKPMWLALKLVANCLRGSLVLDVPFLIPLQLTRPPLIDATP